MASVSLVAIRPAGRGISSFVKRSSNFSRSSALSIPATDVPNTLTPRAAKGAAKLMAVCPPNWQITPTGFSLSMTAMTSSTVNGSKYRLSEVSKSVLTVSGLLLIIMLFIPALRKAHAE